MQKTEGWKEGEFYRLELATQKENMLVLLPGSATGQEENSREPEYCITQLAQKAKTQLPFSRHNEIQLIFDSQVRPPHPWLMCFVFGC